MTYDAQYDLNTMVMKQSIAAVMTGVYPANITEYSIVSKKNKQNVIKAQYLVLDNNTDANYYTLSDQLYASIENGQFDSILHTNAAAAGATSLLSVSCTYVSTEVLVNNVPSGAPTTTASPTISFKPTPISEMPTVIPSIVPSLLPTEAPTILPTFVPTVTPSQIPTDAPSLSPDAVSQLPTTSPSIMPSEVPSIIPSVAPTAVPSAVPSEVPSEVPSTAAPSAEPTVTPTVVPSALPTHIPTAAPTEIPTAAPSFRPSTSSPSTRVPTALPTITPSAVPSVRPSASPSISLAPSLPILVQFSATQVSFVFVFCYSTLIPAFCFLVNISSLLQIIYGISFSTYITDPDLYNTVLLETIADCMPGLTPQDISNLVVTSPTTRRLLATDVKEEIQFHADEANEQGHRRLQGSSISIAYIVSSSIVGQSYDYLSAALTNAVNSGEFNIILNNNAKTAGATALVGCSSNSVATTPITSAPTTLPTVRPSIAPSVSPAPTATIAVQFAASQVSV